MPTRILIETNSYKGSHSIGKLTGMDRRFRFVSTLTLDLVDGPRFFDNNSFFDF